MSKISAFKPFISSLRQTRAAALWRDENGSSLPLLALLLGGIVVTSSVAIQVGGVLNAKSRITAALDAAALAASNVALSYYNSQGASFDDTARTAISNEAKKYFYANFNPQFLNGDGTASTTGLSLTVTPSVQNNADSNVLNVTVHATAQVKASLFSLIGSSDVTTISRDASTTRKLPLNVEIVLALDNTGSMGDVIPGDASGKTKIQALRDSVNTLVTQLYGSDYSQSQAGPSNIKIGIVPYAIAVNVGKLLPSDMVSTAARTGATSAQLQAFISSTSSSGWAGCVEERSTDTSIVSVNTANVTTPAIDYDILDTPPGNGVPGWRPLYTPPVVMRTTYNNGTRTLDEAFNWYSVPNGFPPERYFTRTNTNTLHTEVGSIPSLGQYGFYTYSVGNDSTYNSTNFDCSVQALPLQSGYSKQQISNYVNGLAPRGATHSDVGMHWANRMLSPQAPFTAGAAFGDTRTQKYVVLMTDGVITGGIQYSSSTSIDNLYVNGISSDAAWPGYSSSYGLPTDRNLVNSAKYSDNVAAHEQRLLMACQAAKFPSGYSGSTQATTVYTILLGLTDAERSAKSYIYRACASNPTNNYIEANSADQLQNTFKTIGQTISGLRLTL